MWQEAERQMLPTNEATSQLRHALPTYLSDPSLLYKGPQFLRQKVGGQQFLRHQPIILREQMLDSSPQPTKATPSKPSPWQHIPPSVPYLITGFHVFLAPGRRRCVHSAIVNLGNALNVVAWLGQSPAPNPPPWLQNFTSLQSLL